MGGIKKDYLDWLYAEKNGAEKVLENALSKRGEDSDTEELAIHKNHVVELARREVEQANNYIKMYLQTHIA